MRSFFVNHQNKIFYFLIFLLFVLLQFPSLIETFWYGDEAIYGAIGDQIFLGARLYLDVWDHKPPIIFYLYGFLLQAGPFVGLFLIKMFKFLLALFSLYLIKKLLDFFHITKKVQFFALIISAILLSSPFLEGNILNAEQLFLPVLLLLLLLELSKSKHFLLSSFLIFLAFNIKFHAFIEATFIVVIVSLFYFLKTKSFKYALQRVAKVMFGALAFFMLQILFLISQGMLSEFLTTIISGNINYATNTNNFLEGSGYIITLSFITLTVFFLSLFLWVKKRIVLEVFLVVNILSIEIALALLGKRNYNHYFYQLIPGLILLLAIFLNNLNIIKAKVFIMLGFSLSLFFIPFLYIGINPTNISFVDYYYLSYQKILGQNVNAYWLKVPNFIPEIMQIKNFGLDQNLYVHTKEAWIFPFLNQRVSNKYVVSYHLSYNKEYLIESVNRLANSKMILLQKNIEIPEEFNIVFKNAEKLFETENFELFRLNYILP